MGLVTNAIDASEGLLAENPGIKHILCYYFQNAVPPKEGEVLLYRVQPLEVVSLVRCIPWYDANKAEEAQNGIFICPTRFVLVPCARFF